MQGNLQKGRDRSEKFFGTNVELNFDMDFGSWFGDGHNNKNNNGLKED